VIAVSAQMYAFLPDNWPDLLYFNLAIAIHCIYWNWYCT